ncbi:hypothetical protein PsYK624_109690 [Phanerochaete sordida]|uniref:Chromo domain-containing protein n=1 Tax=Phanerochaete sordida TaxID=48140 RepID=A0A9P3LGY5_9APHY|nr:hypothetical protein PsYK624_109690 [Phanerochaete sordida]
MADRLLPANHAAHQPHQQRQQPQQPPGAQPRLLPQHAQQPPHAVVYHQQAQPQHLQPPAPAPPARPPTIADVVFALPEAIRHVFRVFDGRFQRLEELLADTHRSPPSQSQPQPQPVASPSNAPNPSHITLTTGLASLDTKLSEIQRAFTDARDEQCADMLTVRQGTESVTRALTGINARFGRVEGSISELTQSVEECKELKEQVRTVECLLNELLEKSDDPEAGKATMPRCDAAVMTEEPVELGASPADLSPCAISPLTPLSTMLSTLPPLAASPVVRTTNVDGYPIPGRIMDSDDAGTETVQASTGLGVQAVAGPSVAKSYAEASTSTDVLAAAQVPTPSDFVDAVKTLAGIFTSLSSSGHLPPHVLFDANPFTHFMVPQHNPDSVTSSELPSPAMVYDHKGKGKMIARELLPDRQGSIPKYLSPVKWGSLQAGSSDTSPAFTAREDLTQSPATVVAGLQNASRKRKRCLSDVAKPKDYARSESERRPRRLSTSFSSLSSSRQTSPAPTVDDLRKLWVPSSQVTSQVLEDGHAHTESPDVHLQSFPERCAPVPKPQTVRQPVQGNKATPRRQCESKSADNSQLLSLTGLETETPALHPSLSPRQLSTDANTQHGLPSPSSPTSNAGLVSFDNGTLDSMTPEEIALELQRLDEQIRRELARSDTMDVEELLAVGTGASASTFPEDGMEKDEKATFMALTEKNVHELDSSNEVEQRTTNRSSAVSESSLSTLTSFNSSDLDSDSDSGVTVPKHQQAHGEALSEPEDEEETTRSEGSSLAASATCKRRRTAKNQVATEQRRKKRKVAAALFPGTPPNTLATGQSASSSISRYSTTSSSQSSLTQSSGSGGTKAPSVGLSASAPPSKKRVGTITIPATTSRAVSVPGKAFKKPQSKRGRKSAQEKQLRASAMPAEAAQRQAVPWEVLGGYNGPCKWPKVLSKGDWVCDFIQCSGCDAWYHFGCLGIKRNDPRTAEGVDLFCPPCEESLRRYKVARKLRGIIDQHCARPECTLRAVAASNDQQTYFIERIIGRIPRARSGDSAGCDKVDFMWLFKWMDYDAVDSTWEDSSKVPRNGERYIAEFEKAARAEGFLVDDPTRFIILDEGARAGFRRPGWA